MHAYKLALADMWFTNIKFQYLCVSTVRACVFQFVNTLEFLIRQRGKKKRSKTPTNF